MKKLLFGSMLLMLIAAYACNKDVKNPGAPSLSAVDISSITGSPQTTLQRIKDAGTCVVGVYSTTPVLYHVPGTFKLVQGQGGSIWYGWMNPSNNFSTRDKNKDVLVVYGATGFGLSSLTLTAPNEAGTYALSSAVSAVVNITTAPAVSWYGDVKYGDKTRNGTLITAPTENPLIGNFDLNGEAQNTLVPAATFNAATEDGWITFHNEKIKPFGYGVTGTLNLFGQTCNGVGKYYYRPGTIKELIPGSVWFMEAHISTAASYPSSDYAADKINRLYVLFGDTTALKGIGTVKFPDVYSTDSSLYSFTTTMPYTAFLYSSPNYKTTLGSVGIRYSTKLRGGSAAPALPAGYSETFGLYNYAVTSAK